MVLQCAKNEKSRFPASVEASARRGRISHHVGLTARRSPVYTRLKSQCGRSREARASCTCGPIDGIGTEGEISSTSCYNNTMSSSTTVPIQIVARSPKVYRAMKREPIDNLPVIGFTSSSELGARPGVDITVDPVGNVVLDKSGMSVSPEWRKLEFTRIPKRLRHIVPGATGANSTSCFTIGNGPFQRAVVSDGLELIPDEGQVPVSHGVIAPTRVVLLAQYQSDIENTRAAWQIDET
jgi:hypothetical protein